MEQQATHHSTHSKHSVTLHPHFIVEFSEKADKGQHYADGAGKAAGQIAKSSALRAFRATVINSGSNIPHPAMNASGNLRGMVVSKRSRVIYNLSSNIAEKFEKYDRALAMAGIIIEIAKEADKIDALVKSNLSTGEKWRQGDLIVSTAILRAVTGVVPDAAHVIAKSLEGYCQIAGIVSGGKVPAEKWVGAIDAFDVQIKTAHQQLFSPEFVQYLGDSAADAIFAHIHFN
jgi:hypothetical protein